MSDKKEAQKHTADKKQPGPPPVKLHIDDTPQNVAKSLFGIKSDKPGQITFKRD